LDPTCYRGAAGRGFTCAAGSACASTAVSAKSCGELGWAAEAYGSPLVCGESKPSGSCSGRVPWLDAQAFCAGAGARLCTLAEIQADEARGSGCAANTALVWTSTKAAGVAIWAAPGSSVGDASTSAAFAETDLFKARCCADVF
jgi:hypothetical protein